MEIYNIGVEATMPVIGGKWKAIILCHLKNQTMRSSELRRAIPQITQKMLTQQLRELEADGIVARHIYQQVPPRVDYCLTKRGQSLNGILLAMCTWGEQNIAERQACGEDIKLIHRDEVLGIPEK